MLYRQKWNNIHTPMTIPSGNIKRNITFSPGISLCLAAHTIKQSGQTNNNRIYVTNGCNFKYIRPSIVDARWK